MHRKHLGSHWRLALTLVLAGVATACEDSQVASGSSGTGSATGGTSGGTTSIGPEPFFGTVSLTEANAGSATLYLGSAHFHASDGGDPFACPGTEADSCCLTPPGVTPTLVELSAGKVTFTSNGSEIGQTEPNADGYQTVSSGGGNHGFHWSPGDTLGVSAAGDAILAFSGTALAPPELAGLLPLPSAITLVVTVADGLTLTWTPSSGPGSFHAVFTGSYANVLTCDAPLFAGTLPIPTALLTHLGGEGSFGVWPRNTSVFAGPNANVSLTVNGIETLGNIAYQ